MGIKIIAIGGSVREDNYTWKALSLVGDEHNKKTDIKYELIDPRNIDLPLPGLNSNSQID